MAKEKNGKAVFVLVDVLLGILIALTVAAVVYICISTRTSFHESQAEVKRPEVVSADWNAPWLVEYSADNIIGTRELDVPNPNAGFIFADSDSRYLEEFEIYALTQEEMRIARNEIYARHGRIFNDEALNEYFLALDWYTPLYSAEEMDEMGDDIFNEYEYYNKNLIAEIEEELGYR